MQIIKFYGPVTLIWFDVDRTYQNDDQIVEMGAGTGYWAKLLELRGVDIICYDLHGSESIEVESPTEVNGSNETDKSPRQSDGEEGELLEQYYWTKVLSGTPEVYAIETTSQKSF